MRYLLCFLLLLAGAGARLQPVVPVLPGDNMVNLAPWAEYLEDPSGQLSLADVQQPARSALFRRLGTRIVNFGISSSAFWIRANLQNQTTDKLIVEVGNNALTEIYFYELRNGKAVLQAHSGNWVPFEKREIKNVHYLFPLSIGRGQQATVLVRVKHYRGTQFRFKAGTLVAYYETGTRRSLLEGMYYGFMLVMVLYNLFLFFSLRDRAYFYYVVYIFFMALLNAAINGYAFRFLWPSYPVINRYDDILAALAGIAGILFAASFLEIRKNAPFFYRLFRLLLVVYVADILLILAGRFQLGIILLEINSLVLVLSFFVAAYQTMRSGYRPAKFFLIAWSFLLLSVVVFILSNFNVIPSTTYATHAIQIGSAVEALLLSMALANRINVYKEEKRKAEQAMLRSLEENEKLIVRQKAMLEQKVAERTNALQNANRELTQILQNLKDTQNQLVQREKMASLGELTAGIAHEIQNPLNFVKNFSEVSSELADELKAGLDAGDTGLAAEIAGDLKENLQKISFHGRRADSIVRNMLEHARLKNNRREKAVLNEIVDESLRLSYHALRATDKSFNATLETDLDESVGKIEMVAQDIGRVLLNIFNNAFYSLRQKMKTAGGDFRPVLSVTTQKTGNGVVITIRDNGMGVPAHLLDKIFQPFFTTKPAGEGTGLGLSLSYDIITKEHGGQLKVETKEGNGASFVIFLPEKLPD